MPPVKCMECMDAGYRIWNGVPSPCPACDAGAVYEQSLRTGGKDIATVPRAELNPRQLPPGADVMLTEMKRQAAGLPVGVIGSDVLVRAQVEAQPLVHELVRLLDDFVRDVPGVHERAVEAMEAVPAWAIPDDVRNRATQPEEPEPEQPELVAVAGGKPSGGEGRRSGRRTPPPAAPLEPPTG